MTPEGVTPEGAMPEGATPHGATPEGTTTEAGPQKAFACSEAPTAYIAPGAPTERRASLRAQLSAAGFEVEDLAIDRSPRELRGLIVIATDSAASADYQTYVDRHATDLYEFVDLMNVLLQLGQAAEDENTPPFLPPTHTLQRRVQAVKHVKAPNNNHALMRDVPTEGVYIAWDGLPERSRVFHMQAGFEVVLVEELERYPVLVEGAYGQGRFLLSTLPLDAPSTPAQVDVCDAFFVNLFEHVQAVCGRAAPELVLEGSVTAAAFSQGSSMIAVLPDTQAYSLRLPGLFDVQTSFIAQNQAKLDIKYVLHLGDIVNNNTVIEWQRASASMSLLHGVVPYALVTGNHDYGPSGDASTRDTYLNDYFSFEQTAEMPSFGAAYEAGKLDNSYHFFSIQGRDFIVIALEWAPRDEVVDWAKGVMEQNLDREGILVTHAYLNQNDLRFDHTDAEAPQLHNPYEYATPGSMNDGEQLWQKLVRHHRFSLTVNGHVTGDGCGYLKSTTDTGTTCHQMLSNYQMRNMGGEAYMRLLEFLPDGKTVRVHTYSPLYDNFLGETGHNFEIVLD